MSERPGQTAFELGTMLHQDGLGGLRNLFERAIDSGYSTGPIEIAAFMQEHLLLTALDAYLFAARSGEEHYASLAEVEIGRLLEDVDPKAAVEAYLRAIDSADDNALPLAAFLMGEWLEHMDLDGARDFYVLAINSEHPMIAPRAALRLGYYELESNPNEALQAFQYVEEHGDSEQAATAVFARGTLLMKLDPDAAQKDFEKVLASKDDVLVPSAAVMLGWLLTDENPRRTRELFTLAAEAEGHPAAARAQFELGVMVDDGEHWLRQAATSNDTDTAVRALAFLGLRLAEEGRAAEAEAALERAAEFGDHVAGRAATSVLAMLRDPKLTPQDVVKANVEELRPAHPNFPLPRK